MFDLFALLVLALTVSLIAVMCWPVLERSLANGSRANTVLETPLAWVQAPWLLGWVWFALTAWLVFIFSILLIQKGDVKAAEGAIGAFDEAEVLS